MGAIICERITRIVAESKQWEPKMQIPNTPELLELAKADVHIGGDKKDTITVKFKFTTKYGENAGRIEVEGLLYYTDAAKALEQLEKDWKAGKEIKDDAVRVALINRVLEISFLQAINSAAQIRMPPPIAMPHLAPATSNAKIEKKEKEKAKAS